MSSKPAMPSVAPRPQPPVPSSDDRGIVRSHPFSPGQGSPWQSFCVLVGTEPAIMMAMDTPDFLHHALEAILQKTLAVTELWKGIPSDMVETGGGARGWVTPAAVERVTPM